MIVSRAALTLYVGPFTLYEWRPPVDTKANRRCLQCKLLLMKSINLVMLSN